MPEGAAQTRTDASRCGVCGTADTRIFLELPSIPVQDGLLWATREQAQTSPVGDIRLTFCPSCGYVFNQSFEPAKLAYRKGYDISLHHSPVYRRFIAELTGRLAEEYALREKVVLEIACGNGDFLRDLCRRAGSRGIGFDPSLIPEETDADGGRLTFVADFYSERYAAQAADLVCCRHLLQSVPEPLAFLEGLRRTLGTRPIPVYTEVPNALRIFHETVPWYVVYEYRSFFTPASLARIFEIAGFEPRAVSDCFDGNYLGIHARVGTTRSPGSERRRQIDALAEDLDAFERRSSRLIAGWNERLDVLQRSGRRVAAWGAGGRAITFFNLVRRAETVQDVVDINPKRQGLFLPRTAQRVLEPGALKKSRPDVVLITNPTFEEEIRAQVRDLGLACEFLVL